MGERRGARAAALPRRPRVPPQIARMGAEDLVGAVFPDQIACAENSRRSRDPRSSAGSSDHCATALPRRWTLTALNVCSRGIKLGAVRITVRDLTQPSPLALEVLSARPYAYLDDAPLEERRTQAVMTRRWMSPQQGQRSRPARS